VTTTADRPAAAAPYRRFTWQEALVDYLPARRRTARAFRWVERVPTAVVLLLVALLALLDVIFGVFEMVIDIFQERGLREVLDREHVAEHRLQTLIQTAADRLLNLKKLVVRSLLDFDEVRHLCDFDDLAEILAKPFASGEREGHSCVLFAVQINRLLA